MACEVGELIADRETRANQVLGVKDLADQHPVQPHALPPAERDDRGVGVATLELEHLEVLLNKIVFQRVRPLVNALHCQPVPVLAQLQQLPKALHVVLEQANRNLRV